MTRTFLKWVPIVGAKLGCRDPDDDKLLETALMGAADCLVTGHWDLFETSPFQNISILSPTGFWIFGQSDSGGGNRCGLAFRYTAVAG